MSKVRVLKLRNRLKKDLQVIHTMEVLKQIAISEFRYLENERRERAKFLRVVEGFFEYYRKHKFRDSDFLFPDPSPVHAVVAVSSDEGFLGVLNNQIIDKTAQLAEAGGPGTVVVAIGRRGAHKFADRGIQVQEFPGIPFPLSYDAVLPLKAFLMEGYLQRRFGSVTLVHARCHSFTRQTVEIESLLPFQMGLLSGEASDPSVPDYVAIEPDVRRVAQYTISLWLGRKLYEIFWDSKLSEVASRAIELTERFHTLSRTASKTRLSYFRACHEVIDAGIREVFASHHFFTKNQMTQGTR